MLMKTTCLIAEGVYFRKELQSRITQVFTNTQTCGTKGGRGGGEGGSSRVAALQHQRSGFDHHYRCCLCKVCTFSLVNLHIKIVQMHCLYLGDLL